MVPILTAAGDAVSEPDRDALGSPAACTDQFLGFMVSATTVVTRGARAIDIPFLTAQDLLRSLHMLRC
jgi:hypothetical protein